VSFLELMNRTGFLLVLEGIDGAGKSTLQRRLAEWCREKGRVVVTSREPTDGAHGQALRESAKTGRLSIEREMELFLADRREHVEQVIGPALECGDVVILDRYYFSTAAYQGARGIDPTAIIAANEAFAPVPDLVLLLDLDPSAGHARIGARGGIPDDFEGAAYLAKVRQIFLGIERPFIRRLDALGAPDEVTSEAISYLKAALEDGGRS
jgi:dTMP kinase